MTELKRARTEEEAVAYEAQRQLREYIKANVKHLPDYWGEKGATACIDGIRSMIARGKYTYKEIAEFYGCNVSVVEMVYIAYKKTINKCKKEHEEMVEAFGDMYENATLKNADREGVLRLLEYIVEGRRYED